jgi:hypothetical protein
MRATAHCFIAAMLANNVPHTALNVPYRLLNTLCAVVLQRSLNICVAREKMQLEARDELDYFAAENSLQVNQSSQSINVDSQ